MELAISTGVVSPQTAHLEIVERKGLGHPDMLADLIAEEISCEFSRVCLDRFGSVLHHNVDKLALLGGLVRSGFGFTERVHPIRVLFMGRMSRTFGGQSLHVEELREKVARDVLARRLPLMDLATDVRFEHYTNSYSRIPRWFDPQDLADVPDAHEPRASDTVCVSSAWPPSPVERLVIELERSLYDDGRPKFENVGQDVKIMVVRRSMDLRITIALPLIASLTSNQAIYSDTIQHFEKLFQSVAAKTLPPEFKVDIQVNTQGRMKHETRRVYVLGLGTCLECGEEGLVGRGNHPSGVIAVNRPNIVECPFGKNPSYHAGKVFSYLSKLLAMRISNAMEQPVTVTIVAQQGDMIRRPSLVTVEVADKVVKDTRAVSAIVDETLQTADFLNAIVREKALVKSLSGFSLS